MSQREFRQQWSTTTFSVKSSDEEAVKSRIFVGNLPTDHMDGAKELQAMFEKYGKVHDVSIHKGFGFVQFGNQEDSRKSVVAENGNVYKGLRLDVKVAVDSRGRKPEDRDRSPLRRDRGDGPLQPCRFWRSGNCNKGDKCTYRHDDPPTDNRSARAGPPRLMDEHDFGDRGMRDHPTYRGERDFRPVPSRDGPPVPQRDFGAARDAPVPAGREPGMPIRDMGGHIRDMGPAGRDVRGPPGREVAMGPPGGGRDVGPASRGRDVPRDWQPGGRDADAFRDGYDGSQGSQVQRYGDGFGASWDPYGSEPTSGMGAGRHQQLPYRDEQKDISGMNRDVGGVNRDVGGMNRDVSGMNRDAGGMNRDAGGMNRDAGGMNRDAGGMNRDAGGMNRDAGGMNRDAGSMNRDAGGMNRDAGGMNRDAGGMNRDAGGMNRDAGGGMQPASVATAIAKPPFECLLIACSPPQRGYCEAIERRLRSIQMLTSVHVLKEKESIQELVEEATRRSVPYAVAVTGQNELHRSLTLSILHGTPQEHRNMPLEDALSLMARNFDEYVESMRRKQLAAAAAAAAAAATSTARGTSVTPAVSGGIVADFDMPDNNLTYLLNLMADGRPLTLSELDLILTYVQARRDKAAGTTPKPLSVSDQRPASVQDKNAMQQAQSKQQTDLQNKILTLLGGGQSAAAALGGLGAVGMSVTGSSLPSQAGAAQQTQGAGQLAGSLRYGANFGGGGSSASMSGQPGMASAVPQQQAGGTINFDNPLVQRALENLITSGPSLLQNIKGLAPASGLKPAASSSVAQSARGGGYGGYY